MKRNDAGYMMEFPLILAGVMVLLAIIIPKLPLPVAKVVVALGGIVLLFGLYYMIVIPVWRPGDTGRLLWPWNLIVFILIATVVVLGIGAFVIAMQESEWVGAVSKP